VEEEEDTILTNGGENKRKGERCVDAVIILNVALFHSILELTSKRGNCTGIIIEFRRE